jgi:hypothetical protein
MPKPGRSMSSEQMPIPRPLMLLWRFCSRPQHRRASLTSWRAERTGQKGQAERTCSATPKHSWWSEDVGSLNSFNAGRFGFSTVPGLDRIPTQGAEDSGSNRAEFQVDPRVRGLHFPLLQRMSSLPCSTCTLCPLCRPSWPVTGDCGACVHLVRPRRFRDQPVVASRETDRLATPSRAVHDVGGAGRSACHMV